MAELDQPEDEREPRRGEAIGRFLVLERLGAGGMGVVLAAYDPELGRRVAIKLLRKSLSGSEGKARLQREAQSMARLSHPNVLPVYDVGTTTAGEVFIAMELVPGNDLSVWLKKSRPWREVLAVFLQAGDGLAAAHAAGIVHRDFKPANVLVGDDGRVRVMDFGLAGFARPTVGGKGGTVSIPGDRVLAHIGDDAATIPPLGDDAATMPPVADRSLDEDGFSTLPGSLVGTPLYMSPEQADGTADERSDQFAFCVAAFEALYGVRPFGGDTLFARMSEVRAGRIVPSPADTKVPAWVRRVLVRGLRADRGARYPSLAALLEDLRRDPARARRRALYFASALLIPAALAFAIHEQSARPRRACRADARGLLSSVWNAPRATAIEGAFTASGNRAAPKRWELVRARVDEIARRWEGASIEVCEATTVRHEQTAAVRGARVLCLSQQLRDVDAQLAAFEKADAELVRSSTRMVDGLAPVDRCLGLTAPVPPPEDAAWRANAAEVQARLAEASALLQAGKRVDALPLARDATTKAIALAYPAIEADAWRVHAVIALAAEKPEEAERAAHSAAQAADRANDRELRVTALKIIAMSFIARREFERASLWSDYTRAAVEAVPSHIGTVEEHLGETWYEEEKYDEALAHLGRAMKAWEAAGIDDERLAETINIQGLILWDLGRLDEARERIAKALDIWIRVRGPDHPDVATGWNNLGLIDLKANRLDEALVSLRKAAALLEQWQPDHVFTGTTTGNIGSVLTRQGKHDEALEYFRKDLEISLRAVGTFHPHVAVAHNNIAVNLTRRKDLAGAREHLAKAIEIWNTVSGPEDSSTAMGLMNLGRLERDAGNPRASLAHYEKATPVLEKVLPAGHVALGKCYAGTGLTWLALGDRAKARPLLERGLKIAEANPEPSEVARCRFGLARALGGGAAAQKLAGQARDYWSKEPARFAEELRDAEAWLASPNRATPD